MRAIILAIVGIVILVTGSALAREEALNPRKVEVDSNYDGVVDRIEFYSETGEVVRVESDTNFDGRYDEWVYYENGKVKKAEKDTNGDGKADTWLEY